MRHVGVLEAKTTLSALLDAVEKDGETVVITRHGKPVARLSAAPAPEKPRLSGAELAARFKAIRDRAAEHWQGDEPFDWKAAVEEGRE